MSPLFDGFTRVRALWPDHLGLPRGKYLPADLAHRGTGFCASTFGLSYAREIIAAPGAHVEDGLQDIHGHVDETTIRRSWEDDRTAVALLDLSFGSEPYDVSSRWALKHALSDWASLGYAVRIGIELEGYLLEPTADGGWQRYRNPRSFVYGTGALGDPSGFLDEVLDTARCHGFRVESCNVEFDESQFEFTLHYDDALTAVDDAFLFRVMTREIAIRRGLDFTYLGKPFPDLAGSGVHVNVSLVDQVGNLVLSDPDDAHGITDLTRHCLAGLIAHHRALTALCAPTVNAYRRLQPGNLAGCWADWGIDNRGVTSRIPPSAAGSSMRIEHRLADGAVNLHLGAAAILQAARLGVVNRRTAPAPFAGTSDGERVQSAATLAAALDDLEADEELRSALGSTLTDNFLVIKRHESSAFTRAGGELSGSELSGFELRNYLPYH